MRQMHFSIAMDQIGHTRGFAQGAPGGQRITTGIDIPAQLLGAFARSTHTPFRPARERHPALAAKRRLGRAVLAVVEGAVTAKILRKRDGKYFLAPANSREAFPEIELTEDSEIWGVIAGVVRRYDLA